MKYSICLSVFAYKPWLVREGGLTMRVAYPMNFIPSQNKPRSNISRAASGRGLAVVTVRSHPVLSVSPSSSPEDRVRLLVI